MPNDLVSNGKSDTNTNDSIVKQPDNRGYISVLYRRCDVAALLGISISTVNRWIKENKLPKQTKFGSRFVAWRKEIIDAWIDKNFDSNNSTS